METGQRALIGMALALTVLGSGSAQAASLDGRIPGLFGGSLRVTLAGSRNAEPRQPGVTERFRSLSPALAAARSQAPIPSTSGSFRFTWDPRVETFVRSRQSLGPGLAERAQTLGRGSGTVSVSYTNIGFDSLEGDGLGSLRSLEPAFSDAFLNSLPEGDRALVRDDKLDTRLRLSLQLDQLFVIAAYGVTNALDISLALSLNHLDMAAQAEAHILDNGDGGASFARDQLGLCDTATFLCARDGFEDDAFGTGDLFLRAKYLLYESPLLDAAAAAVLTLPTGNADDFLGFHDPTFTPWLILSNTFDRVGPHLNLGYAFRGGDDVSQAQWIAGADVIVWRWLTLSTDFLGFHDDKRDGINDDVIQWAAGFKLNPLRGTVIAVTFQIPVNRDGLRADVIYTGQIEYTF